MSNFLLPLNSELGKIVDSYIDGKKKVKLFSIPGVKDIILPIIKKYRKNIPDYHNRRRRLLNTRLIMTLKRMYDDDKETVYAEAFEDFTIKLYGNFFKLSKKDREIFTVHEVSHLIQYMFGYKSSKSKKTVGEDITYYADLAEIETHGRDITCEILNRPKLKTMRQIVNFIKDKKFYKRNTKKNQDKLRYKILSNLVKIKPNLR